MARTQPTIKAAKAYCKARYGRLPRCGREMFLIAHEDRIWVHGLQERWVIVSRKFYLQNVSGTYRVVSYAI